MENWVTGKHIYIHIYVHLYSIYITKRKLYYTHIYIYCNIYLLRGVEFILWVEGERARKKNKK